MSQGSRHADMTVCDRSSVYMYTSAEGARFGGGPGACCEGGGARRDDKKAPILDWFSSASGGGCEFREAALMTGKRRKRELMGQHLV